MTGAIKQVSEHVWYLPAHPDPEKVQPLVGIVVGNDETILIDAGNTPALAHFVLSELQRIKAPPVRKIIYTHHHWDHVFGASAYDVQTVAHTLCATELAREAEKPWSATFLASEVARDSSLKTRAKILQAGIEDWSKFKIVIPSTTFENTLTLK